MKCHFCKNEVVDEDEGDNSPLHDSDATPDELVPVHEECVLDYFAWLKRKGRPLKKHWNEKARKMFEGVDAEYRSDRQTRVE